MSRLILRSSLLPERHVEIGLPDIAIPLGDFVLEDEVVAERIPGMPPHLPVILVRIIAPVRKDDIGRHPVLRPSNQSLISALPPESSHP